MNEPSVPIKPRPIAIVGFGFLVLAIAAIFFSTPPLISKPFVESRLKIFGDAVSARAAAQGRSARFSHGGVALEGWGFNKRAVVQSPKLEVTEASSAGRMDKIITTERVIIEEDPVSGQTLITRFPEPLDVSLNGKSALRIRFNGVPAYAFSAKRKGDVLVQHHQLTLPPGLSLIPIGEEGEEEGQSVITVAFDPKPVISLINQVEGGEVAMLRLRGLSASNIHRTLWEAADLQLQLRENGEESGGGDEVSLSVDALAVYREGGKLGPYNVKALLDYNGPWPQLLGYAPGFVNAEPVSIKMTELSLASAHFQLAAQGALTKSADDPLPHGQADIHVKNFPALRGDAMFAAETRPLLQHAAVKMTGQAAESLGDFTVAVRRDKLGTLRLGQVTFEELTASLLAASWSQGTPADAAPSAGESQGLPAPAVPSAP